MLKMTAHTGDNRPGDIGTGRPLTRDGNHLPLHSSGCQMGYRPTKTLGLYNRKGTTRFVV